MSSEPEHRTRVLSLGLALQEKDAVLCVGLHHQPLVT